MKKQFLAVLLSAVLLLGALFVVSASAASDFTISAGDVEAPAGSTVTVTVTVANNPGFAFLTLTPSYDKSVLTLTSATNGTILKDFDDGENLMWSADDDSKVNGTLVTLTFTVSASAAQGEYPITLRLRECFNINDGDVTPTVKGATLTVTCSHSFTKKTMTSEYLKSEASCSKPTTYYYACEKCDAKGTATYETGTTTTHSFTKEHATAQYLKTAASCNSVAVYYKSCSACGAKGTETFESGTELGHAFETGYTYDETNHWHACTRCSERKDQAAHVPGSAATEATPQTCTTCGCILQAALSHTHQLASVWSSDETSHWKACAGCSTKDSLSEHIYDDACDLDCNTCGRVRIAPHELKEEWSSDAQKHWHACTLCGLKSDETEHTPGAEATDTTPQTCTICGYIITPVLEHEHVCQCMICGQQLIGSHGDRETDESTHSDAAGTTQDPMDTSEVSADGCGSLIASSAGLLVPMVLLPAMVILRKERDD